MYKNFNRVVKMEPRITPSDFKSKFLKWMNANDPENNHDWDEMAISQSWCGQMFQMFEYLRLVRTVFSKFRFFTLEHERKMTRKFQDILFCFFDWISSTSSWFSNWLIRIHVRIANLKIKIKNNWIYDLFWKQFYGFTK